MNLENSNNYSLKALAYPELVLTLFLNTMITYIETKSCPKCKKCYDVNFSSISTNLGPTLAKCNHCKTVFKSGKKEWAKMSPFKKILFWILSILYAIIFGGLCGIMTSCLSRTLIYGRVSNWPPQYSPVSLMLTSVFILAFITFIFYAQIKRINDSNIRSSKKYHNPVPVITSIASFDFGLQAKFLYLFGVLYCTVGLLMTYYK